MKQTLLKHKTTGLIDFIEVPLNWGKNYKEYIGFDFNKQNFKSGKHFFRIFYDNKYRENDYNKEGVEKMLKREIDILNKYKEGLDDRGIYNTTEEYNEQKKVVNFIKKYICN